jgi:hypothetical protein
MSTLKEKSKYINKNIYLSCLIIIAFMSSVNINILKEWIVLIFVL